MFNTKKQSIRNILVLLTLVYTLGWKANAQTQTMVTGKVAEKGNGDAIPGVSVVEINANDRQVNGVVTDQNGNYKLRMSDPANSIRFSYIGFKSVVQKLNGRSAINVSLEPESSSLVEVAIVGKRVDVAQTGFGSTATRDKIGAITSVKGELLDKQPVTSIDQMLQGRAAGVQVVSNSGDPGAGTDIRIRGAGSISAGNDPLYIIDGIPIVSTPYDNTDAGRATARISPIADINPSDIERIDVLKDANAAAIYGARAANGVIMITTKRGKPGVTNVTFNTQFNLLEAPPAIPTLSGPEYKIMRLEAEQNNGNINPANNLPLVDDPTYVAYQYYQANTNWIDLLRQTGFGQVYNRVGSQYAPGTAGAYGYANALSSSAKFNAPRGIVCDASNNIYVCDFNNNAIRKIAAFTTIGNAQEVTTLCGAPETTGIAAKGNVDGTGLNARFDGPSGICR